MALVVLGMHRSGTSALARVLALLGAALPRNLLDANPTNPTGHWESEPIAFFNESMLAAAGTDWFDWQVVPEGWRKSLAYDGYVERARALLQAEFEQDPLFVLKEPRMCRFGDLWLEALAREGVDAAVIIPVRNPLEVVDSLKRRDGVEPSVALLVWLRYLLDAERATRGRARIFVSYEQLLGNWAGLVERIERELGVAFPRASAQTGEEIESFLSRDLRHNVHSADEVLGNPLLSAWFRRAYELMLGWCEHGEKAGDLATLDSIREAFDEAAPAFVRPLLALGRERAQMAALAGEKSGLAARLAEVEGALAVGQSLLEERDQMLAAAQEQGQQQLAAMDGRRNSAERRLIVLDVALGESAAAREALAVEADRLRGQLGEVEIAVEHAQARAELLEAEMQKVQAALLAQQHRAAEVESALAQRQEEVAQVWAELEDEKQRNGRLEAELAQAGAAQGELAEQLAAVQAQADLLFQSREAAVRHADALAVRAEAEIAAQAAAAQAEIDRLMVENQLARGEYGEALGEIARLAEALESLRADHADQEQAREAVALDLVRSQAEMARLNEALREVGHDSLRRQSEATNEIVGLTKILRQAEESLQGLHGALAQARQEAAVSAEEVAQGAVRLGQLEHRAAELEQRYAEAEQRNMQAEQRATGAEHRANEAEQERGAALAEKLRADQLLAERFGEIATMTSLLREYSAKAAGSAQDSEWLRQVHSSLVRAPRWWGLMPAPWQRGAQLRRLAQAGLFDGAAYLARYPDVAAQGIDPLRHYITFGMAEGRLRH